jgi:hypothetical protein
LAAGAKLLAIQLPGLHRSPSRDTPRTTLFTFSVTDTENGCPGLLPLVPSGIARV